MNWKIKKVYEVLIEGAKAGLTDSSLFQHVLAECPKATSKKIVRASLWALSDPNVKDANVLQAVYGLAIQHRLDPYTDEDIDDATDEPMEKPSKAKKSKAAKKLQDSHAGA